MQSFASLFCLGIWIMSWIFNIYSRRINWTYSSDKVGDVDLSWTRCRHIHFSYLENILIFWVFEGKKGFWQNLVHTMKKALKILLWDKDSSDRIGHTFKIYQTQSESYREYLSQTATWCRDEYNYKYKSRVLMDVYSGKLHFFGGF